MASILDKLRPLLKGSILLLACLTLVGCQSQFSQEPTDYSVLSAVSGGKFDTKYLKAEHPDVQAVIGLTQGFLGVLLNQDYQKPDLELAKPMMTTTTTIGDYLERTIKEYATGEISVHLKELRINNIAFVSAIGGSNSGINSATVTAEATVWYSQATKAWLTNHGIALNEDRTVVLRMEVRKEIDVWKVFTVSTTWPPK